MDFLKKAEAYAQARGDEYWFKEYYTYFRKECSVTESVWRALSFLYDNTVADFLEQE